MEVVKLLRLLKDDLAGTLELQKNKRINKIKHI